MKKSILNLGVALGLATTFSTSFVTNSTQNYSSTVQAAKKTKWHKGMPKVLHGNWYGQGMVLKISNKHVYFIPTTGASVSQVKKVEYTKSGRTYKYRIYWVSGGKYQGTIHYINKHTVKFNGYKLTKR